MTVEFLLMSLVVVVIPGTGVIYTLSCALSRGFLAVDSPLPTLDSALDSRLLTLD